MKTVNIRRIGLAAIACALTFGAASTALAGNVAVGTAEATVISPPDNSQFQFSGAYVGGGLGFAVGGDDQVGVTRAGGRLVNAGELKLNGALGEVHAGYRWNLGGVIYGLEMGVDFGKVSDTVSARGYSATSDLDYAVTLRGGPGVVLNNDTLVYGFLGVSHGQFSYGVTGNGGAGPVNITQDASKTGYVAGFGLERALNENWSLRGEYQYSNYGRSTLRDAGGASTQATPDFHALRVGVNFNF